MIVTTRQLAELNRHLKQSVEKGLEDFIRENFEAFYLKAGDRIESYCIHMMGAAKKWGLKKEQQLQYFTMLDIRYDLLARMTEDAALREIVSYPGRPAEVKLNYVHKHLIHSQQNSSHA